MARATEHLASRVTLTTTRLVRLLRQQDQSELTLTMRSALSAIERYGPMTLGALGRTEHIAPATVTKVVGKLADRGLVERLTDPSDGRVCKVAISRAGASLLATGRKRRTAWLADRLSALTPDERQHLELAVDALEALLAPETEVAAP